MNSSRVSNQQSNAEVGNLLEQLYVTAKLVRNKAKTNQYDEITVRILSLATMPGGIRPGKLTKQLSIGAPALTKRIHSLESDGLIETHKIEADGRSYIIVCTAAGKQYLRTFQNELIKSFSAVTAGWSTAELVVLVNSLERLNQDMARHIL